MLKDKFRRYTSSSKDPPPLNLSSTIKCLVNSVNKKQQQNAIGFGITSQFSISSLSSWLFIDTKCVLLDFICNWSDFRQISFCYFVDLQSNWHFGCGESIQCFSIGNEAKFISMHGYKHEKTITSLQSNLFL